MKLLLTIPFCILLSLMVKSQDKIDTDPIFLTNSASKHINNNNSDSAIYYIRKLAVNGRYGGIDLFINFIHNQFAQPFGYKDLVGVNERKIKILNEDIAKRKQLLRILEIDTNILIQKAVRPICSLTDIRENTSNNPLLITLISKFIENELSGDIYENKQARYGLLIYNIISKNAALKSMAENLISTIKEKLLEGIEAIKISDTTSRIQFEKRAWFRYLYAVACYQQSKEVEGATAKEALLEKAFTYSPDLIDISFSNGYFYEMMSHFDDDKDSFLKSEYLKFLKQQSTNKYKILSTLSDMSLIDIKYKKELETFYKQNYEKNSFNDYWLQFVMKSATKKAPTVNLTLLDQTTYTLQSQSGKWVLVDFWGTWCGPCKAEHPALNQFYRSSVLPNSSKLSLLTIACRDTYERVVEYMKEKKFSFPVAMSDGEVEKLYNVQGYPTKVLINPIGNYTIIPFGIDWVNFIKKIINL